MENSSMSARDFEIMKDLGAGSFGKVQLAKKKSDQQLCAIKSVLMSKLSQKEKENALNQVRLLASIHIPYVIGYKGAFFNNESQSLCVVMEYADGGDLQQMIKKRPNGMEQNYIWKVGYEILMALKMLHAHNIAHRDIKTANVFFSNGIAKLGDLNVSKVVEKGFCETQTGTPYYTAPEIWKGEKYTEKCDIWSTGCLIYEMCTGKPPFRGKDFPSLYKKVIVGEYDQIPKNYTDDLKHLIRLCLSVDFRQRLSAKELLDTNVLSGMELSLQKFRQNDQQLIELIDPINCPRVLKFLNNRLPKNQFEAQGSGIKKNVGFATKKQIQDSESMNPVKSKSLRKIRSEKMISIESKQKIGSKKLIRLPPLQHEISNEKKIVFSTKNSKGSSKLIPGQKQNKKLHLF